MNNQLIQDIKELRDNWNELPDKNRLNASQRLLQASLEALLPFDAISAPTWTCRAPEDDDYMAIEEVARRTYQRHKSSVGGQQFSRGDGYEMHLILAAIQWERGLLSN